MFRTDHLTISGLPFWDYVRQQMRLHENAPILRKVHLFKLDGRWTHTMGSFDLDTPARWCRSRNGDRWYREQGLEV